MDTAQDSLTAVRLERHPIFSRRPPGKQGRRNSTAETTDSCMSWDLSHPDQIKDEPPKDFQTGFLEQLVQNAIEAGEPIDLEKDDLDRFSTHAIQGIIQICQDFVTDNLDTLNSAVQMNGGDHAGLGRMLANALTRKQPGFQTPELGDAGKELQRDAATLPDCKLAVDADGTVKLWQTQPSATGTKIRPGP